MELFSVTGLAMEGPPAREEGEEHTGKRMPGNGSNIASAWGTAAGGEEEGRECAPRSLAGWAISSGTRDGREGVCGKGGRRDAVYAR